MSAPPSQAQPPVTPKAGNRSGKPKTSTSTPPNPKLPLPPSSWAPPSKRMRGRQRGDPSMLLDDELADEVPVDLAAAAAAAAEKDAAKSAAVEAVSFLAAKADIKANITEQKRKMTMKSFVWNQLTKHLKDLTEADKLELAKQGDVDGLLKLYEKAAKAFDDMLLEIPDIDTASLDGFKTRYDQQVSELTKHVTSGESIVANAVWLLNEQKKEKHHAAMSQRYKLSKSTKMFTPACGDHFAKVLAEASRDEKAGVTPIVSESAHMKPDQIMLFKAGTEAGDKVITGIIEYMTGSSQALLRKLESLKQFLNDSANQARPTAAAPVKVHGEDGRDATVPDLAALVGLPDALEYESMEGSSPWLVLSRWLHARMGPGGFPLPGFASLIAAVEGITSFYLIQVKHLVEAGIYHGQPKSL